LAFVCNFFFFFFFFLFFIEPTFYIPHSRGDVGRASDGESDDLELDDDVPADRLIHNTDEAPMSSAATENDFDSDSRGSPTGKGRGAVRKRSRSASSSAATYSSYSSSSSSSCSSRSASLGADPAARDQPPARAARGAPSGPDVAQLVQHAQHAQHAPGATDHADNSSGDGAMHSCLGSSHSGSVADDGAGSDLGVPPQNGRARSGADESGDNGNQQGGATPSGQGSSPAASDVTFLTAVDEFASEPPCVCRLYLVFNLIYICRFVVYAS
jgi:hypothetical protein